ncbi:MAG: hypothetical protein HQL55_16470 [Magnetococcales bacterium]|nr:hypothetical protein [Magnetococcales bacterium]
MLKKLIDLPSEMTSRWKDRLTPASYFDKFRPFAEGKTNGAGDPRELHLFCKNYQPPGEPVHG